MGGAPAWAAGGVDETEGKIHVSLDQDRPVAPEPFLIIELATGASTTYHLQSDASASEVQAGKTVQVQLDLGGQGRPSESATTSGPVGTAGSVTVVP